jgi:hypothetical protein
MNCYECGGSVAVGARFCRECGAPAAQTSAVETRVLPSSPSSSLTPPSFQQNMVPAVQHTPPQQLPQPYSGYPQQQPSYPAYPPQHMQQQPLYAPQQAPGYAQQPYGGYPQQPMPGYQPVNVNIYNTNQQAPMAPMMPVMPIIVAPQKSVGLSLVLTFLFGPLGMFYSTVGGALAMLVISFIVAIITFGIGLMITWPVCMIWGAVAASQYNQRMIVGPRY